MIENLFTIKEGNRTLTERDLIRVKGEGQKLFRIMRIARNETRTWLDIWGPINKAGYPLPKAKVRSILPTDVTSKPRQPKGAADVSGPRKGSKDNRSRTKGSNRKTPRSR